MQPISNVSETHQQLPQPCECSSISKVIATVARFFQSVAHIFITIKDRVAERFDPRRSVIRHIIAIQQEQRQSYLKCILPWIAPDMTQDAQKHLIQVATTDSNPRRSLLPLVIPSMHGRGNCEILRGVGTLSPVQRESIAARSFETRTEVIANARRCMVTGMNIAQMIALLQAFFSIPAEKTQAVANTLSSHDLIITAKTHAQDMLTIVQAVSAGADQLLPTDCNGYLYGQQYKQMIEIFAFVTNSKDPEATVQVVLKVIQSKTLTKTLDGVILDGVHEVMRSIAEIPEEEREDFAEFVNRLIPQQSGFIDRVEMLPIVVRLYRRKEKDQIATMCQLPCIQEMLCTQVKIFLFAIADLPEDKSEKIIYYTNKILLKFIHNKQLNCSLNPALEILHFITRRQRNQESVIEPLLQLFSKIHKNGSVSRYITLILDGISEMTCPEACNVVHWSLQFIAKRDEIDIIDLWDLMKTIRAIPPTKRETVLQKALGRVLDQHDIGAIIGIIQSQSRASDQHHGAVPLAVAVSSVSVPYFKTATQEQICARLNERERGEPTREEALQFFGLSENFTPQNLGKEFRLAMRQWHPDKTQSTDSRPAQWVQKCCEVLTKKQ